jgi:galactose mutarotase-like enzyme
MKHFAKNQVLEIAVRQPGAELLSIKSLKTGIEYMWNWDPSIWNSTAPVLFPIVGPLKEGFYIWEGEKYYLNRHGFVRDNPELLLTGITADSLTFGMASSKETHKIYPFDFEFSIQFKLVNNKIHVIHKVKNTGNSTLYFSLGGHPAFRCPILPEEKYDDYFLEFENIENISTILPHESGLLSDNTFPILKGTDILPLTHELFNNDALIFTNLKSRKITIRSKKSPQSLSVSFEDFPYVGIWAKTNGDMIAIEPWLGIGDKWDTDQQFKNKEGLLQLSAGAVFEAEYVIEINEE